jgi:hypothetical protein
MWHMRPFFFFLITGPNLNKPFGHFHIFKNF